MADGVVSETEYQALQRKGDEIVSHLRTAIFVAKSDQLGARRELDEVQRQVQALGVRIHYMHNPSGGRNQQQWGD